MTVRNPLVLIAGQVQELPAADTLNALGTRTTVLDADYANVSLLLHGNGTNGSTTFTDNSSAARTVTAVGSAQVSTAQSKFGGSSVSLPGAGSKLTVPNTTDFDFSAKVFTVEAFAYLTSSTGVKTVFSVRDGTTNGFSLAVYLGNIFAYFTSTGNITSAGAVTLNQWVHVAYTMDGTTFRMFVDGVLAASATPTVSYSGAYSVTVGDYSAGGEAWVGYLDDLRVTKGVARYTGNFTPPIAAHSDAYSAITPVTLDELLVSSRGRQYANARAFALP